jgi:hypothetical protein
MGKKPLLNNQKTPFNCQVDGIIHLKLELNDKVLVYEVIRKKLNFLNL